MEEAAKGKMKKEMEKWEKKVVDELSVKLVNKLMQNMKIVPM